MADIINGSDLFVFMAGVKIADSTNHALSFKMKTRDTSNKDSGIFDTKDVGRFDVSASCEGMMVYGHFNVLFNAMRLRTPVALTFGEQTSGGILDTTLWYAHGDFIITSCEKTAPDQGNSTYKVTFEHYANFGFTPDANLIVNVIGFSPASAAVATAGAAAYVVGGIAPYTYVWTFTAGGAAPAVAGKNIACNIKAAVGAGTTYTCTVTDSTPVTPITGVGTVVLIAAAA